MLSFPFPVISYVFHDLNDDLDLDETIPLDDTTLSEVDDSTASSWFLDSRRNKIINLFDFVPSVV